MKASDTLLPRVYVACLACYNAGKLHGHWIDADNDIESHLREAFGVSADDEILPCGGEEMLCHDNEDFGAYDLGEENVQAAGAIGEFLLKHGYVGSVALSETNGDIDEAEEMMDRFIGEFQSLEDYICDYRNPALGIKIPEDIAWYVDWERFAADCESNGEFNSFKHDDRYYVFGTEG
jgi:antirestriction protein